MAIQELGNKEVDVVAGGLAININWAALRSTLNAFSANLTASVTTFNNTITAAASNLQTLVNNFVANLNLSISKLFP